MRSEDPVEAEVAVVVADPWQGLGVGSALLERLVERAREEGIRQFVAIVLSDNEEALEMFRNLAPDGSWIRRGGSGQSEMLIELPEAGGSRRIPARAGAEHGGARGTEGQPVVGAAAGDPPAADRGDEAAGAITDCFARISC